MYTLKAYDEEDNVTDLGSFNTKEEASKYVEEKETGTDWQFRNGAYQLELTDESTGEKTYADDAYIGGGIVWLTLEEV